MTFFLIYLTVFLLTNFGGAWFFPKVVKYFDGYREPPWGVVSVLWPLSLVVAVLAYSVLAFNKATNKLAEAAEARLRPKTLPLHTPDPYLQEAEQEVDRMLGP